MGTGGIRLCGESQQSAAECSRLLGGLGGLEVGDLSETCVLDYWVGSGGLMGSGGKWSRFSSNAVEQTGFSSVGS